MPVLLWMTARRSGATVRMAGPNSSSDVHSATNARPAAQRTGAGVDSDKRRWIFASNPGGGAMGRCCNANGASCCSQRRTYSSTIVEASRQCAKRARARPRSVPRTYSAARRSIQAACCGAGRI